MAALPASAFTGVVGVSAVDYDAGAVGGSHRRLTLGMYAIPRDWIERAARVYKSNPEASRALGIATGSFSRLCRKYGIETPYARQRRDRQEARSRRKPKGRDRGR